MLLATGPYIRSPATGKCFIGTDHRFDVYPDQVTDARLADAGTVACSRLS